MQSKREEVKITSDKLCNISLTSTSCFRYTFPSLDVSSNFPCIIFMVISCSLHAQQRSGAVFLVAPWLGWGGGSLGWGWGARQWRGRFGRGGGAFGRGWGMGWRLLHTSKVMNLEFSNPLNQISKFNIFLASMLYVNVLLRKTMRLQHTGKDLVGISKCEFA